ncbi:MAG: serine protease [Gammaproteobacteria bacterium]
MRRSGRAAPRLLAALIAAAIALPAARAENGFPDVVDRIRPAIVGIGTWQATRRPPASLEGTGFVVGDGTIVATNAHVVARDLDGAQRERRVIFVGRGRQPEMRGVTLRARDDEHDLAILAIEGAPLPALRLAGDDAPREGEDVAFTGFPIGAVLGLYPVTHQGSVSAITPIVIPARASRELSAAQVVALRDPYDVLQLDATAYPGNSGSPVYRRDTGAVIGVINQVMVKGKKESALSDPSGITYAIPVRYLRELLERSP